MRRSGPSTFEHPIGPDGLLLVSLGSGDVHVLGEDGDVARIAERDGEDLGAIFDIEAGDASLALRAGGRGGSSNLEVRVPRRETIVIEAGSADLVAEDLAGDQRFNTASGDVELRRVSGAIAVEVASGDVELSAAGALRLQARTVSGDLTIRAGVLDALDAATTSGDLAIAGELTAGARHQVETVSGDALLALAGGARIEVSTVTGDIAAEAPHRSEREGGRRVVTVGDGRATLRVRTMSGDVHIVRAVELVSAPTGDLPRPVGATQGVTGPVATVDATRDLPEPEPNASEAAIAAAYDEARLAVLRRLERGEIDVAEAGRRLEALETAGHPEEANRA